MKGKKLNTTLIEAFNKQINQEFHSAYLYFAMSTYFDEIMMKGFSSFMKHKASEKLNFAQKIYDYIVLRDEKLTFLKIEEPIADWINVSDIFSAALIHEESIEEQLNELYKISLDSNDFAACEFILEILKEQLKSIGIFRKLVFRIKNSDIFTSNIEHLESKIEEFIY